MNSCNRPILWNQGLFLQPHHFQQFDAYINALVTPHNLYHTPFFWGCGTVEIQATALGRRTLEVERCELIFQDGTWITFPGNAALMPRSFKNISFDVEGDRPFTVYLAIKKWELHRKNTSSTEPSDALDALGTRFVSSVEPEEVKDIHEGGEPASLRKMDYLVKIFWEDEIEKFPEYLAVPVAQLRLDADQVVLSKNFVPPLFRISSSDTLMQMLKNIREMVISRCRVFESYKFAQGFQSSDFDAHFIPHLLVLSTLNRALPSLNHMIEVAHIHPHAVYALLRAMVGDLSTFTDRINALGQMKDGTMLLPEYDHEALFKCFNEARQLIGELLQGVSLGGESIINLSREKGIFSCKIPFQEFGDGDLYFIVVRGADDTEKLISDFNNIVKIGTIENIDNMIARALPGVTLKHRLVPPPGMPRRPDVNYFRIDTKHNLWSEIKRSGTMALYWSNAPDDITMEMVISKV
ncbi:MAG: type VI secretion system baseplate subunit TssK [Desulfamplus sp.]|nr:type VI secretion system baseplate subunit TssK [Desulfamplus sp.]